MLSSNPFSGLIRDTKPLGILNVIIYIIMSFLILPIIDLGFGINVSSSTYIIWYVLSIMESIYTLYMLTDKVQASNKDVKLNKTIYDFFTVGGISSYQNIFVLAEKEPLYEYGFLLMLLLVPVKNEKTNKEKIGLILGKVGLFHVMSSLILMDWDKLVVNYNYREIRK